MKIVYCPADQDPMELAKTLRHKPGRAVGGSWWVIPTVIVFLVIGVTVGPLKGLLPKQSNPVQQTTQPATAAQPELVPPSTPPLPALCQLPDGGQLASGWTAWIVKETNYVNVRCNNGILEETQETP